MCDVETSPYGLDSCNVDVTRPPNKPARAEITFCLNDVSERIEDVMDVVRRSAGVLDRLLGDSAPGTK